MRGGAQKRSSAARSERMLSDLAAAGLKLTAQRRAIVQRFAAEETHPTAQELYERLRGEFPGMSFATVYNTLDALTARGLSSTLRLGTAARFDPNIEPHHHAVCDGCGAVVDVPAETLAPKAGTVARLRAKAAGFTVHRVERIYRGLCARCEASRATQ